MTMSKIDPKQVFDRYHGKMVKVTSGMMVSDPELFLSNISSFDQIGKMVSWVMAIFMLGYEQGSKDQIEGSVPYENQTT